MKENNGIGHTKMCTVVGCKKTARTNSSPYCKMHYHRLYRMVHWKLLGLIKNVIGTLMGI